MGNDMSLVEKCAEDGGCRPVRELNTKVEIHETTLYGKNEDGLTYKIKDCLTRKALWVFIASTSFIIFAGFVTVNTMWADTRDYPETKKQVQSNTLDIVALKAKQDAIYNLLVSVDRKLDKKEEPKKVDPEKEE
jgi:hypothetical protein